ncbi:hypothetical protein D3Z51_13470 [Clostridiaceae bacterium]|nr:hypothetical protein [Clostridiaceae bacterium]RKI08038.1 hypothetical protein D7V81_19460 [bacterium 1XD21-70]
MGLDLTKVMVLLQRKYSSIREISRLTNELKETFARNDEVSAVMLLEMRAEEMAKVDACVDEIWRQAGADRAAMQKLRTLLTADPAKASGNGPEEKKIYEIRRKTQVLLEEVRMADQKLNRSVAREKSFYGAGEKEKRPVRV